MDIRDDKVELKYVSKVVLGHETELSPEDAASHCKSLFEKTPGGSYMYFSIQPDGFFWIRVILWHRLNPVPFFDRRGIKCDYTDGCIICINGVRLFIISSNILDLNTSSNYISSFMGHDTYYDPILYYVQKNRAT